MVYVQAVPKRRGSFTMVSDSVLWVTRTWKNRNLFLLEKKVQLYHHFTLSCRHLSFLHLVSPCLHIYPLLPSIISFAVVSSIFLSFSQPLYRFLVLSTTFLSFSQPLYRFFIVSPTFPSFLQLFSNHSIVSTTSPSFLQPFSNLSPTFPSYLQPLHRFPQPFPNLSIVFSTFLQPFHRFSTFLLPFHRFLNLSTVSHLFQRFPYLSSSPQPSSNLSIISLTFHLYAFQILAMHSQQANPGKKLQNLKLN